MTEPTSTAFVIDDDRDMRRSLADMLGRSGWDVRAFSSAAAALQALPTAAPEAIVSDVRMPGMSGLDLLDALGSSGPPLVLISAHGDIPMAVDAMRRGAYSFMEKPFDPRRLLTVLSHAAERHRLTLATRRMQADLAELSGLNRVLLGQDEKMRALRDEASDLAAARAPVLITGDTGTGKELIARALHRLGPRRDAPFVAVNCATLDAAQAEAVIFGAEGGPRGLFRRADGGTLFLDEVGACSQDIQARLLRAVETGEIAPAGSDVETRVDLRLLAATNEDLTARVNAGTFRDDFFYRLATFRVHLPPLRDRGEDAVLLYQHFVQSLAETYEIEAPPLTPEDAAALLSHDWPGNVRELRHVAERRVLAARRGRGSVPEALAVEDPETVPGTLREAVAAFERTLIAQALTAHGGRMDAVAEALGIGRRTLNEKIVKLGLDKSRLP